jgi:hypothetical protein
VGIAIIQAHKDFRLRVAPEAIEWHYTLNTKVTNTYGGKVVQVLSVTIENMSVPCLSGNGGREYLKSIATFFKEMILWQRDTQTPAVFSYAPRSISLKVYGSDFTLQDYTGNVTFPFSLGFRVQEDLLGTVKSRLIVSELLALNEGIGYIKSKFNDPESTTGTPGSDSANQGNVPPGAGGR